MQFGSFPGSLIWKSFKSKGDRKVSFFRWEFPALLFWGKQYIISVG